VGEQKPVTDGKVMLQRSMTDPLQLKKPFFLNVECVWNIYIIKRVVLYTNYNIIQYIHT
jgi:hypothetical protein